ncbi:MAG TPA: NAD-dependent epimerase/dehydratase family protein [Candidatus Dormibacteraeota bacterium]|nr:NAD-dependent epimerase/dehydratase family protein [Candidatus Dormibacteraeota bacterium]
MSIITEDVDGVLGRLTGDRLDPLAGGTMLVTGAGGFLAGYLVDTVARANRRGLLSPPCGLRLLVRRQPREGDRLGHLLDRPDVSFIVADVNSDYPLDAGLTHIVHAASAASPRAYGHDPLGTIDANTAALRRLLAHAAAHDLRSLLYLSSSEVYGDPPPEDIPTSEAYPGRAEFTGPRACYAESKRFGETLCDVFHRVFRVPVKVVRPFHVYGPGLRLDDGRIVPELIRQGLQDGALRLLSDGRATRCYGYAADATYGFLLALLSEHQGTAFNIGVDEPQTSIGELAAMVAEIFGLPAPEPATQPLPEHLRGAPHNSRPNLARARELLGYRSWTPLRAGLERTVEWFRAAEVAGAT